MSNMSLQICVCGWSKTTTYQGLRIHQGKMGCTPKGLRIPESEQFSMSHYRPQLTFNSPLKLTAPAKDIFKKSDSSSDESLQVCSCCGWSKITTYQGLRTHQGKMGCTPKGTKIPESERFTANSYLPAITFTGSKIELEEPVMAIVTTSMRSDMKRQVCHCGWSEFTTDQGLRIHQMGCKTKRASVEKRVENTERNPSVKKKNVPAAPNLLTVAQTNTATEASVIDTIQSKVGNQQDTAKTNRALEFNNGKESSQPSTTKFDNAHRALDFSAGAQQVLEKPSTTTTQPPEEKEKEAQKLLKGTSKLTAPAMDNFNTSKKSDSSSDESLQVCSCGWSKITTYHGLRTHQGKMGCTPKGTKIPESERFTANSYLQAITFTGSKIELEEPAMDNFTTSTRPDMKRQVCHCGWSELTNDQGLRIHQMGCKPKRASFAKIDEYTGRNPSVQNKNVPAAPNLFTTLTNTGTEASVMDMIQSMKINQDFEFNTGKEEKKYNFNTQPVIMSQTFNTQIFPAVANVTVKEANDTYFQTPPAQRSQPSAVTFYNARRALNFYTGAQQVLQKPLMTTTQRPEEREAQKLLKAKQDNRKAEIRKHIHIMENKVAKVISSSKSCKISLDAEWVEINSVFTEVIKVVEDARRKALQPLEDRWEKLKMETIGVIQELEREIDKLKKSIFELDVNPDLPNVLDGGLTNVSLDTSSSFGSLRTTTSAMMEQIHQKLDNLSSVELKRIPSFSVDIRLDPLTAHQCLVLSDDGKTVRGGGKQQRVPDTPERFDLFGSVMARNSLTSGRSYWEVGVSNKTGWDLGVARRDANRKGALSLKPDDGYWAIVHYEERKYAALAAPPVSLSLSVKPQKVGVFVDRAEGLVSFYDATARSHIYTFEKCSLGGEILPYFSPHLSQSGRNSDPLIICSG